jgi:hypothetical protein
MAKAWKSKVEAMEKMLQTRNWVCDGNMCDKCKAFDSHAWVIAMMDGATPAMPPHAQPADYPTGIENRLRLELALIEAEARVG